MVPSTFFSPLDKIGMDIKNTIRRFVYLFSSGYGIRMLSEFAAASERNWSFQYLCWLYIMSVLALHHVYIICLLLT